MAKTRPNKKPPKVSVAKQGSKGPVHTQMPRPQGGKPRNTGALTAAKSNQMNTSMKKPGSGTRGSGKGAH
jgi:hypothetical protein